MPWKLTIGLDMHTTSAAITRCPKAAPQAAVLHADALAVGQDWHHIHVS